MMVSTPMYGQFSGFLTNGEPITMASKIDGKISTIEIKSGKELDIFFKDRYDSLVRFIESRQPISTINKVDISLSIIGFDDGTFWSPPGVCYKYDHDNPGQIIKLPVPELISTSENP